MQTKDSKMKEDKKQDYIGILQFFIILWLFFICIITNATAVMVEPE